MATDLTDLVGSLFVSCKGKAVKGLDLSLPNDDLAYSF